MSDQTGTSGTGELVVLLDEGGSAIGTAPKRSVHHEHTPLHLAFSAYLFDSEGALLVTRRALDKATFPGVWTNSLCGHPAPGERLTDAIGRRARDELGLDVTGLRLVLPRFRYHAEMAGVTENELCPVFVGNPVGTLDPHPAEVADTEWVPWARFAGDVLTHRREVSVWCLAQVTALSQLGPDVSAWPTADGGLLPPAAR